MQIKPGASIVGLDIRMRPALLACEAVIPEYGKIHNTDIVFVITCGLDGTHSAGSLHYYGLAIDVRTRDLRALGVDIWTIVDELKRILGSSFNVVKHKTHIHIEYDAR